jgi:SulP family sulfate permease
MLAAGSVATIVLWRRLWPRIPAYIVVLVAGTALAAVGGLPVETIGSRFGGIEGGLPAPRLPHFTFDLTLALLAPALTIAMLGAVESLLSAVVADRMGGDRHEPNVELVAQGVANLAAPLFGGLPATGAIARTATNIRSGARTPIAGMLHALTLLAVLLVAAPIVRFVPLAVLAGILVVVAYQMGEWGEIKGLVRLPLAEVSVWALTFALTVVADLTVAVEAGLILAMFLALRRLSETTTIELVDAQQIEDGRLHILHDQEVPGYVAVFRIYGPLLFGTTGGLLALGDDASLPEIVILKLRHMTAIDATGLHALEQLAERLLASGRHLIVCGAASQPAAVMASSEFADHVGAENVCANTTAALGRARAIHAASRSAA